MQVEKKKLLFGPIAENKSNIIIIIQMKITTSQYGQILESLRPLVPKLQAYLELTISNPRAGSSARQVRLDAFYSAGGPSKLFPCCNYSALDSAMVRAMNDLGFPEFSK